MMTEQQLPLLVVVEDSIRLDAIASSRDSLRKEVNLRRNTLTPQELGFLTGLLDSGSDLEVSLAALKLSDTTLFYARSGDEDEDDEDEGKLFTVDDEDDDALTLTLRKNSDKELAVVPGFQAKQDSARRQESLQVRRQSQLHGQIWKAHQNGLAVSQKSSQRSFLQREKSWSSRRMTLVAGPGRIAGTSNIFNNNSSGSGSATRRSSLLLRQSSTSRLVNTFQNSVPIFPSHNEKYDVKLLDNCKKPLPAFRRMNSGPAKLASSSSYSRRRRASLDYNNNNNSNVALPPPKNVPRVTLAGSSHLHRTNATTTTTTTTHVTMMTSWRRHETVPNRRASTSCLMGIPENELQLQPQQSSDLLVERPESDNINIDGTFSLLQVLQPQVEHGNNVSTPNEKNRERQREQISSWEGTVLPEEQEDKKSCEEELFKSETTVQEPEPLWQDRVEIRRASVSNYDGEGMEVAHVLHVVQDEEIMSKSETFDDDVYENHNDDDDNEDQRQQLLREEQERAIVMRRASVNVYNGEGMEIADWDALDEIEERREHLDVIYQRGASGHHHNKTTSFDVTASIVTTTPKIPASHSFDETRSRDRTQSFPEAEKQACMIYRSFSEDELASFFTAHTSMRNKEKTNSDVTATTVADDDEDDNESYDGSEYDAWVDNPEVEGGILDVISFRILGTSADDVDSHPHVLSPPLMESLQSFFPFAKTSDNFWMKYSLVRDGASMHTLLQHARGAQFSILALETVDGEVMGAFTTERWRKTWSYFGGGDSFLWRMRHSRKTKCHSIIDQAHLESEIEVFPFTGENHCIQFCTSSKIAVGGGSPADGQPSSARGLPDVPTGDFDSSTMSLPQEQFSKSTMNLPAGSAESSSSRNSSDSSNDNRNSSSYRDHEWGYGISLEKDLLHGSSSPCVTFRSPPLSDIHSDGSLFEIINIELWTLTPCYSEEDALKLELGRLFLEEHSFYDQSSCSVGEMFG